MATLLLLLCQVAKCFWFMVKKPRSMMWPRTAGSGCIRDSLTHTRSQRWRLCLAAGPYTSPLKVATSTMRLRIDGAVLPASKAPGALLPRLIQMAQSLSAMQLKFTADFLSPHICIPKIPRPIPAALGHSAHWALVTTADWAPSQPGGPSQRQAHGCCVAECLRVQQALQMLLPGHLRRRAISRHPTGLEGGPLHTNWRLHQLHGALNLEPATNM